MITVTCMPTQNPQNAASSGGLVKRKDAAAYLGTSPRRLDELIRAGKIAALRDGGVVKFTQAELERYVRDLPAHEPVSA